MTDLITTNSSVERFEFQKALFAKGCEQVQSQIAHLDEILFKVKASAVTVWVALMGWAFTSKEEEKGTGYFSIDEAKVRL